MPCYHPIVMYRSRSINPETGKRPLTTNIAHAYTDLPVLVPCGQCIGCRLSRSREWAVRCIHESTCHAHNCFITLTFSPEALARISPSGSLEKREFQLFMKRLRFWLHSNGYPEIRFFHCGEYGSKKGRPHHHAIIFGFDFPDKKFIRFRNGFPVYRSALLEELWKNGMCEIGSMTFESAAYISRYVLKKITGDMKDDVYHGKLPEYITMSNRPGIGANWYARYNKEVFPNGFVYVKRKDGIHKCLPPRYYRKLLERENPELYEKVYPHQLRTPQNRLDAVETDAGYRELRRREAVQRLALDKLKRPLEAVKLGKVCDVIMTLNLYSVFDEKSGSFAPPFYMQADGMALRLFDDQINDYSHPSLLADHPEDFSLYRIGTFTDEDGKVVAENVPVLLAHACLLKKVNVSYVSMPNSASTKDVPTFDKVNFPTETASGATPSAEHPSPMEAPTSNVAESAR